MKRSALVVLLVLAAGASALAQRGGYRYSNFSEPANPRYDGRFMFNRLKYTVGAGGYYYRSLPAWAHGEPYAEENLMKILESISVLRPHVEEGVVMGFDDPEVFKFPVAFMTEASYWVMGDAEGAKVRDYLEKGGFIIFDDFRDPDRRGGGGLDNLRFNLQKAIPGAQLLPMDVNHPIFHCFFEINSFDIVPQAYDASRPSFFGLFEDNNENKRLMAIVNYNTDISQYWEFSGRGYFVVDDSNEAFKLGVNYLIYGITH